MTSTDLKIGDLIALSRTLYKSHPALRAERGIILDKKEVKAKNLVGRGGYIEVVDVLFDNGDIEQIPLAETYNFEVLS
jgi:hypothetical protein